MEQLNHCFSVSSRSRAKTPSI